MQIQFQGKNKDCSSDKIRFYLKNKTPKKNKNESGFKLTYNVKTEYRYILGMYNESYRICCFWKTAWVNVKKCQPHLQIFCLIFLFFRNQDLTLSFGYLTLSWCKNASIFIQKNQTKILRKHIFSTLLNSGIYRKQII